MVTLSNTVVYNYIFSYEYEYNIQLHVSSRYEMVNTYYAYVCCTYHANRKTLNCNLQQNT